MRPGPFCERGASLAIKAIFLDIDGTLVRFNEKRMNERTLAALKAARERGVSLFIVTGRYKDGIGVDAMFDFDGYSTANGEYCFMADGEVIHMSPMDPGDVRAFASACERRGLAATFTEPDDIYFCGSEAELEKSGRYQSRRGGRDGRVRDWSVVGTNPVLQMVVDCDPSYDAELLEDIPGLESARWSPDFMDVVERGRGKGDAIDAFCERLGITPAECMAIGDGGNDVHMLVHAGIGVAMGQAADDVKAAADVVAPPCSEDGAAWAIEKYVLGA